MNREIKLAKRAERTKIVNYLYYYELMTSLPSSDKAFESGEYSDQEIKKIEMISVNYLKFKKLLIKYIKSNWEWSRLSPYVRSILIYGSFEFLFTDKNLVINEMVEITKAFAPDDSYKLINGILEKIGDYYEQIKMNKKTIEN